MRSHLLARLIAATALLAGAVTGVVATASSAGAIPQCTGGYAVDNSYSVPSGTSVYVSSYNECTTNPALSMPEFVSVSKYVGNVGWEVVATGTGVIIYSCTGGRFLYTTNVTTAEGKPAFYCG